MRRAWEPNDNNDISNGIIGLLCELFLFLFLFRFDLWTTEERIKYTKLIINYEKSRKLSIKFRYRDIGFLIF